MVPYHRDLPTFYYVLYRDELYGTLEYHTTFRKSKSFGSYGTDERAETSVGGFGAAHTQM